MRKILFTPIAFDQFNELQRENKTVHEKLKKTIKEVCKSPFEGTGKPEPLKHGLSGLWSRRITDEHRLIYAVKEDYIEIIACKYHYK